AQQQYAFDPIPMLDATMAATPKRFAFSATTPAEATAWQERARVALAETLGFLDTPPVAPEPREIERVDRGRYERRKIILRTSAHSELPLYLLIPKDITTPRPAELALHVHSYRVKT